jgi:hypothetical protein
MAISRGIIGGDEATERLGERCLPRSWIILKEHVSIGYKGRDH